MIVLDANLLLYAYDTRAAKHKAARIFVENILSGSDAVGLPWQSIAAFLRVATNPILPGRISMEQAVEIVAAWIEQPNVTLLGPGEKHWTTLRQMLDEGQVNGPMVTNAQLAALTIEHGGILHTTDRDFARFPGLRWKNPLAG